jgi:hypothetical protein
MGIIQWSWFGEAWHLFKREPLIWISSFVVPYVPLAAGYGIYFCLILLAATGDNGGQVAPGDSTGMSVLGDLVVFLSYCCSLVIQAIFSHSTSVIANKQVRGQAVSYADLFRGGSGVLSMLLFCVAFQTLFLVGVFVFIVPGVLVVALLTPAMALVADGVPAIEAMRISFNAMKRDWLGATLFAFAWNLLIVVSAIPCGLGIFATVPMVNILMALVYRDVIGYPEAARYVPGYGGISNPLAASFSEMIPEANLPRVQLSGGYQGPPGNMAAKPVASPGRTASPAAKILGAFALVLLTVVGIVVVARLSNAPKNHDIVGQWAATSSNGSSSAAAIWTFNSDGTMSCAVTQGGDTTGQGNYSGTYKLDGQNLDIVVDEAGASGQLAAQGNAEQHLNAVVEGDSLEISGNGYPAIEFHREPQSVLPQKHPSDAGQGSPTSANPEAALPDGGAIARPSAVVVQSTEATSEACEDEYDSPTLLLSSPCGKVAPEYFKVSADGALAMGLDRYMESESNSGFVSESGLDMAAFYYYACCKDYDDRLMHGMPSGVSADVGALRKAWGAAESERLSAEQVAAGGGTAFGHEESRGYAYREEAIRKMLELWKSKPCRTLSGSERALINSEIDKEGPGTDSIKQLKKSILALPYPEANMIAIKSLSDPD